MNALTRNLEAFEAANPEIAAWWANTDFDFAVSLRNQVMTKGFLSERQLAAAQNCVAKRQASVAARAEREANAPTVDVTLIEHAFGKGQQNGLTKPTMRLFASDEQAYRLSLAPAHGRNAGAIYVKRLGDDEYMGKIFQGRFTRVGACSDAAEAAIVDACANPERSAIAYGRAFGSCSCCGRQLTNELSIELGIGPICRAKFF